jgi:5'-3' exonuclease
MASTLSAHVDSFVPLNYPSSKPAEPFEQLLSVLPPKSAHLLPKPLDTLLLNPVSELRRFCPEKIKIDLAGKRREWEGITLLPMVDKSVVLRSLNTKIRDVKDQDMTRNNRGYVVMYEAE